MSGFQPDDQTGRPGVTRRSKIIAAVILGVCVVVGAVALSFPGLDSLDQRWTTCEVTEAIPFQGDNTSMQPWKALQDEAHSQTLRGRIFGTDWLPQDSTGGAYRGSKRSL